MTKEGAYFTVEQGNYGTGPVIIFRPDNVGEYRAGDRFKVTINGLKSTSGAAKTISYAVEFMSAENYVPPAASNSALQTHFTDISNHWAKKSIEWAAKNNIVSDINGPFRPNDSVKEEEFLRMFADALKADVRPAVAGERWSARYYHYAGNNGYTLQGSTYPAARQANISRLAVAELIASAAGYPYTGDSAILFLLDNGYSQGKTAATVAGYAGGDFLTRAEAVQFIKNLIEAGYTP